MSDARRFNVNGTAIPCKDETARESIAEMQDDIDEITTIIKGISYDPASRSITIPGTIGVYSNRAITLAL